MEFDSETCYMALDNVVTGATHFELAKTDVGGPRYLGDFRKKILNDPGLTLGGRKGLNAFKSLCIFKCFRLKKD